MSELQKCTGVKELRLFNKFIVEYEPKKARNTLKGTLDGTQQTNSLYTQSQTFSLQTYL